MVADGRGDDLLPVVAPDERRVPGDAVVCRPPQHRAQVGVAAVHGVPSGGSAGRHVGALEHPGDDLGGQVGQVDEGDEHGVDAALALVGRAGEGGEAGAEGGAHALVPVGAA